MVSSTQPRGPDWTNAAARLGIALSVPILASLLFKALGGQSNAGGGVVLFLMWMLGFGLGWAWAWEAWHGGLAHSTVRVADNQLTGRAGWPLRRWRSVRLDQLVRVRCYRNWQRSHEWIVVCDPAGGPVMVEFLARLRLPRGLRRELLSAI